MPTEKCDRPSLTAATVPEAELRGAIQTMILRKYVDTPKSQWKTAAATIAPLFNCKSATVLKVFEAVSCEEDARRRKPGSGRPAKVQVGTAAADRIMGGLAAGYGQRWTASLASEASGTKISQQDVHRAARRFEILKRQRPLVKTGNRNKISDWAKARKAICLQFRADLAAKKKFMDGTLFADEHTERCVLAQRGHHGQGSRVQYSVPKKDGVYCKPADGGTYSPVRPITKPKFDATASGCFAVAAPTVNGVRVGKKAAPIRYTGTVVGVGRYERELQKLFVQTRALGQKSRDAEAAGLKDKRGRKKRRSVWHEHCDPDKNPYESRFGPGWQDRLPSCSTTNVM